MPATNAGFEHPGPAVSPASSNAMSSELDGNQNSPANPLSQVDPSHQSFQSLSGSDTAAQTMDHAETKITEGTPRKKRRSRKGLSKRFTCAAEGCGKSYSRAEHLYRHQLNHNSAQVFECEYAGCSRTFVRADLQKRHMDRHAAKGFRLDQNEHDACSDTQAALAEITPPFSEHYSNSSFSIHPQNQPQYLSPRVPYQSPYTPVGNTSPNTRQSLTTGIADTYPVDAASVPSHINTQTHFTSYNGTLPTPSSSAQSQFYHEQTQPPEPAGSFTSHPEVVALNMRNSQYSQELEVSTPQLSGHDEYATAEPQDYHNGSHLQNADLISLDQIPMPSVGPVFGDDGGLNKSPYVGMPEDFMAYLFNSLPQHGSPPGYGPQDPSSNYGELQDTQFSTPFMVNGSSSMGHSPTASQHIMSVTNLLGENSPEINISDERSREIFDFINDRFYEQDVPPAERQRERILGGNRDQDDHMLSKRMMQAYLGSYWYHFSDQLPILHRPTFSSDKTPNLLLLAIMTIGAACLDRTHGQHVLTAGAKVSNFIARHLRWEIFMDTNFRPPAKLWVFQTLILLELYEKMFSTRELHERAHIHHATMITLMRRGRSLSGKSPMDSPPNHKEFLNGMKQSIGAVGQTPEESWNNWVTNEATRRAAFAAFIIDSTHSTMFGHSTVMVTHEMRLPLPCDESLWRARSSAELGRAETNLISRGIRPISFLEGLKRTLSHQEVQTTSFGRTALMAGLMSVTYHMNQRDLQVNVLGGGVIQALGGRDKWRAALTRAYDSWKGDFDKGLKDSEPYSDPYGQRSATNEAQIVFGSHTVLHHLAHMAMYADIVDCQMFARAKRLLGKTIRPQELSSAQKRVKEQWAPSAKARDATFYALKFLSSVLLPDGAVYMAPGSPWPKGIYETRYDVLMNRPWVLYFAALVVWCYGYALEGPCSDIAKSDSLDENQQKEMQTYLRTYAAIRKPDDLQCMRGINNNTALLKVLRDSFENTRWDLLHEGAHLMRNCIILNCGGNV
ncbi:hypothetical protein QQS21_002531 [Conoideocrella luteorostrata]|uniref:C2H2-type domain-containing protein n=1 Tax=Conoideocrella luteorostrata TaxID=1105319 RepID=A0AAJ0CV39_9HYPO|nr:hypothetical protein QQS21_002531 [Conoideocrella luteorostrata]